MKMTLSEYDKIKQLIYDHTGMAIKGDKFDFLARRMENRIEMLNLSTPNDYFRYLKMDPSGEEIGELINMVVISETYFFREYYQLRLLAETILPLAVEEKKKAGSRNIKILSAGCATGEEPYTLGIIGKEMLENPASWKLDIHGVDINPQSLKKARNGIYTDHALRETPYMYREKYFTRKAQGYQLDPKIMDMVAFSRVNLYDEAQMRRFFGFDFVFCKNVLIYFDRVSSEKVMEHLYRAMNPGGYVFLGSAESVGRLTSLFQIVRFGKNLVYRK